ncbi:unnamed protein product [Darwinula stevensoni]|uniref:COMMD1 N-terminal domain-containing protein n=1 Tax=Darwinula stevensoni TaxID=69355 RepID=A0A7R8X4E3_9CRUS|nr:unnamed protein product [Darwinula stevensoni]CAG0879589.1 unnamed protein product [Darwinula stevensoni]
MALEIYVRETAAKVISDAVSTDGREMELLNMMLEGMPHLERSKAVTIHEKCKKLIKAIISSDMEKRQLDAFLTSSVKKKDGFPEDLAHVELVSFMANASQLENTLKQFEAVDMQIRKCCFGGKSP